MALGHTAKVRSGEITDLRDFALLSLRAWRSFEGEVAIDYDVVRTEEQPNPYYARKLEEAQSRLASLKAMRAEEAALHARETHSQAHSAWSDWTREKKARRRRTDDMLKKLKVWKPPTRDLTELKDFISTRIQMLKSEMNEKVGVLKASAPAIAVGAVLAITAWILFSLTLAFLISICRSSISC